MMRIIVPSIVLLALSGCATNSLGPVTLDSDSNKAIYYLSASTLGRGSPIKAEARLLKQAVAHCAEGGKKVSVEEPDERALLAMSSHSGVGVVFTCE